MILSVILLVEDRNTLLHVIDAAVQSGKWGKA